MTEKHKSSSLKPLCSNLKAIYFPIWFVICYYKFVYKEHIFTVTKKCLCFNHFNLCLHNYILEVHSYGRINYESFNTIKYF